MSVAFKGVLPATVRLFSGALWKAYYLRADEVHWPRRDTVGLAALQQSGPERDSVE
jgi:hypothetical protein